MSATAESTAADGRVKSHTGRRRSRNKKSDPFLELSDNALDSPDKPSPSTTSHDENSSSRRPNSVIADFILTPISVISFVLSLLLVDRQQRRWRFSQHAPAYETSFWHQFAYASPEPYQESEGTTWHPRLSWRRRGVAKAQMKNVFDMRRRVVIALAAWSLCGLLAIAYSIRRMYYWIFA